MTKDITRLKRALEGDVLDSAFDRGRYATDASIYQIEPIGVVVPKTQADLVAAVQIAAEEGVPILPRGAGTSQCGQTVGEALGVPVMDWHWVFHSLVYHTPLPKKEYEVVEREKP